MKRLLVPAAVGALAVLAFATPANATNTEKGKDRVEHFNRDKICNIQDLNYNNTKNLTLENGATAETTDKGLKLTTPVREDHKAKLSWKVNLTTPVLLSKFTSGGMLLTKVDTAGTGVNDSALLSYDIFVTNGSDSFTVVYEPYWNGTVTRNNAKLWVVDGSSKVWGSPVTAWPGNVNAEANKTIAQLQAMFPAAKITGYGYHQGTWNDGASSLLTGFWFDTNDSVKEGYAWTSVCNTPKVEFKDTCIGTTVTMTNSVAYLTSTFVINETKYEVGASKVVENVVGAEVEVRYGNFKTDGKFKYIKHTWVKPNNCASPSPSNSVTAPVTPGPTGSATLPVTGSKTWVLAGSGTLLVAIGVAVLLVLRKKDETKFIVE